MGKQFDFGNYENILPNVVNEPHMPVLFLCDTSISMGGEPIRCLIQALNRFAPDVCKDPKASELVDVAVMGFNNEPYLQQGWCPVSKLGKIEFAADGGTDIPKALTAAIEFMRERTRLYESIPIDVKMPYIILITDGYGGDVTEIAKIIKERTDGKKMQLWILAVKGYDTETVAKLSEGKRVFELVDEAGYDFTDFIRLMSVSCKKVSVSTPGSKISISDKDNPLKRADSNLKVPDLDDWLNN